VQNQGSRFLGFSLTPELKATIETDNIQGVLSLNPSQIVKIPGCGAATLGVHYHRGEVLWLLDLARFLGLRGLSQQPWQATYSIVVIQKQHKKLGLMVLNMGKLLSVTSELIDAPTAQTEPLTPELSFCALRQTWQSDGTPLFFLDTDRVMGLAETQ
jgi:chemotaxis signal transduction protein